MKKIFSIIGMIAIAFTLGFGSAAPATQSFCSTDTFSSTSNNEVSVTASAEGCEAVWNLS
ncbi:MAG: hypothetical protein GFH27_549307n201 [Chloroflexi bacterium AL-W]|nr:hypothetical protein [Chloroflexi bacterium AL-N1]NOK69233.1 hypothetical protein [Chloroflexi bacterium AL-N10]NOK77216.1 hypothetical protein [Chloroflexi bacterium AL-N5]NOK83861.1 hypothetical protein [Chloroflexi bacterium AL-W]NOK91071.1 hypothetical protein [Chloroflexi bacterium AL-N15]